jgi:hypothetical protein
MSNKYNFIKLQKVALRNFSLYRKDGKLFEVNEIINDGVYCLAGANGLGKTTFLNSINYGLTGLVVEPNKEVFSPSEITDSSKEYTRRYFVGRIHEKHKSAAEIEITFKVNNYYYRIIRGFFERESLRLLEIFTVENEKKISVFADTNLSPVELNAQYQQRLAKDIGFVNFDFFIFYQLYVLTFDENRNMIFWDERASSSALAVAFNSDPDDAEKISDVTRRMEKHESNGRNARWQATQAQNKLKDIEQESKKRKPVNLQNLEQELNLLYNNLEKSERVYNDVKIEHDTMLKKQSVLNSEIMLLKNEHSRLFSKYSKPRSKLLDNTNVQFSIKKHQCALCGSTGSHILQHVEKNIHKDNCPLCDTAINDANSEEQTELLRYIELNDTAISNKNQELEDLIVEMGGKVEQLEKAEFEYYSFKEKLDEFTNDYPDVSIKSATGSKNVDSLIDQYRNQFTLADQESKDEYLKRDKLKPVYEKLLRKVENAYEDAELEFVPIFKKLAKSFIGMDLNIQPKRGGKNIKLVLELQNTARTAPFQLSESQRFFLDIALRMSLAIFLSGDNGATILVDTPEGSLDIAYESRVGNMFAEFAVLYKQNLFMTANINASQLLISLAEKCGNDHMKFRRMLDWTDLTEIQREGEGLFQMVYSRIETALNTQVKPEAFFDSLSLAHKLDNFLDGFKLEEIHLFAYFSSILFLYRGNAVSDWQYKFTVNKNGYPFSTEINEATSRHIQNGLFEDRTNYYSITARGVDEYLKFKPLSIFAKREDFLNAACTTSILVPYAETERALLNDFEIEKAKSLQDDSWLDQSKIYQKFQEISQSVGVETKDLLIPAITWVSYLNEKLKS